MSTVLVRFIGGPIDGKMSRVLANSKVVMIEDFPKEPCLYSLENSDLTDATCTMFHYRVERMTFYLPDGCHELRFGIPLEMELHEAIKSMWESYALEKGGV